MGNILGGHWRVSSHASGKPVSTAGLLVRFAAAGLIILLALTALTAFIALQAGTVQATESARRETSATARGVVEPRLNNAVITGQPAALAAFDSAMHQYVLKGLLIRVKLWDADGRIIYSDEPRLIGARFPLGREEAETLRTAGSSQSDGQRSEPAREPTGDRLRQIGRGVRRGSGGEPGSTCCSRHTTSTGQSTEAGLAAWHRFAGPSLAALLVLELAQIPVAWSLARRVQRQQRDVQRLRQHAVQASDSERRRIAGELHDGVVQDLTGVNYTLDSLRLGNPTEGQRAELIAESASRLRGSIGSLRSLLVDSYPADVAEIGLSSALAGLAARLERAGFDVQLDTEDAQQLPPAVSALLFRAAQEVVRNVAAHSGARTVRIAVRRQGERATLVIADDGRGFDKSRLDERTRNGHVGLRSMDDLLAASGGQVRVWAAPGHGTRVLIEGPVR